MLKALDQSGPLKIDICVCGNRNASIVSTGGVGARIENSTHRLPANCSSETGSPFVRQIKIRYLIVHIHICTCGSQL